MAGKGTLQALLLSDGRPGHYTLAEGILAAIARLRPVEIERVEVRRPRWVPARFLSTLLSRGISTSSILRHVYGLNPAMLGSPDLIVSAGGDTLAANVAVARLTGAPNIFYGSLRRYRPEDFALVLTSYARHAGTPRHLVVPKPSKLDPESLGGPAPRRTGPDSPAVTAGLLVGGNAGTVQFSKADWDRLGAFLRASHREHGTRWLVATSPRTPPGAADGLVHLAEDRRGPIADLIDFRRTGPGTLGRLFERAEAIVVTSDSSSMLSEAIWVRRPVVAVSPERGTLPADEQDYRRFLEESGWTASLAIRDLTPQRFLALIATIRPIQENPLDRLAGEIKARLPQIGGDER